MGRSDIVDTEPAGGNVWKMLLGPINETFDDDPEDLVSPHSTVNMGSSPNMGTHTTSSPSPADIDRTNTGTTGQASGHKRTGSLSWRKIFSS